MYSIWLTANLSDKADAYRRGAYDSTDIKKPRALSLQPRSIMFCLLFTAGQYGDIFYDVYDIFRPFSLSAKDCSDVEFGEFSHAQKFGKAKLQRVLNI